MALTFSTAPPSRSSAISSRTCASDCGEFVRYLVDAVGAEERVCALSSTVVALATSWSSGSCSTRADSASRLSISSGRPGRGGVDVGGGAARRRRRRLAISAPRLAARSSSVSWRSEARLALDVVDGAAGAQVGDQAARLGERRVDRAGSVRDALAAHQRVDAVDGAGGRGDEVVERQALTGRDVTAVDQRRHALGGDAELLDGDARGVERAARVWSSARGSRPPRRRSGSRRASRRSGPASP